MMLKGAIIFLAVVCQINSISAGKPRSSVNQIVSLLRNNEGKKMLSGIFGGWTNCGDHNGFSLQGAEQIKEKTGKYPAIIGIDCAKGWDKTAPGNEASVIECMNPGAVDYANRGGIVAVSVHLPNPFFAGNDAGGTGAYKTPINNDQYKQILQSGSQPNQRWRRILDKIAAGLAAYQAKGITVLYRPLHEMNGEWFWWGATGYNTNDQTRFNLFKQLWRDMHDYFTNKKGLRNLVWVYSPDAKREHKTSFYPGGQYVDVTGLDAYLDDFNNMSGYDEMLRLGKPFGLGEVGPDGNKGGFDYGRMIDTVVRKFPKTTYFIPWNAEYSPVSNQNARGAYNNGRVMNRGEFRI